MVQHTPKDMLVQQVHAFHVSDLDARVVTPHNRMCLLIVTGITSNSMLVNFRVIQLCQYSNRYGAGHHLSLLRHPAA